jgi:hypothetical protein
MVGRRTSRLGGAKVIRALAALQLAYCRKANPILIHSGMSAADRPQKITFAEMRESDGAGAHVSNIRMRHSLVARSRAVYTCGLAGKSRTSEYCNENHSNPSGRWNPDPACLRRGFHSDPLDSAGRGRWGPSPASGFSLAPSDEAYARSSLGNKSQARGP